MNDIDQLQERFKAIANIVNAFKSEAVQLRVVEALITQLTISEKPTPGGSSHVDTRVKRKPRRKKGAASNDPTSDVNRQDEKKRKVGRGSGSPGSFSMMSQLLADGFFKTPRTIGAITAHCSSTKGHRYKSNECSPALLRLLRDDKLVRAKNKDGQYEYSQA